MLKRMFGYIFILLSLLVSGYLFYTLAITTLFTLVSSPFIFTVLILSLIKILFAFPITIFVFVLLAGIGLTLLNM